MLRRMRPAGARSSPSTQTSIGPRTLTSTWWLIPSAASHLKATQPGRSGDSHLPRTLVRLWRPLAPFHTR